MRSILLCATFYLGCKKPLDCPRSQYKTVSETAHTHFLCMLVVGGLLVKALDCGFKDPGFQSHLQQRFISLLGALSPTSQLSRRFFFVSFGGDITPSVPGNPLKLD